MAKTLTSVERVEVEKERKKNTHDSAFSRAYLNSKERYLLKIKNYKVAFNCNLLCTHSRMLYWFEFQWN